MKQNWLPIIVHSPGAWLHLRQSKLIILSEQLTKYTMTLIHAPYFYCMGHVHLQWTCNDNKTGYIHLQNFSCPQPFDQLIIKEIWRKYIICFKIGHHFLAKLDFTKIFAIPQLTPLHTICSTKLAIYFMQDTKVNWLWAFIQPKIADSHKKHKCPQKMKGQNA